MLKEQAKKFGQFHMVFEYFLVGLAFFLAIELQQVEVVTGFISQLTGIGWPEELYPYSYYNFYIAIGALYWVLALRSYGAYGSVRKFSYSKLTWVVLKAVLVSAMLFDTIVFVIDARQFNRGLFILIFVLSLSILLVERYLLLFALHTLRRRGYNYRQFIIVGTGSRARRFAQMLESHQEWGFKFLGYVDEPELVGREIAGKKVIGSFADFEKILDNNIIDEVVFCMPRKWLDKLEQYIMLCEKVGIKVHLALDLFNTVIAKPRLTEFENTPLLTLDTIPIQSWELLFKRCTDIFISAFSLVVTAPLMLLIAVAIRLDSPGAAIFKQERIGKNGRKFAMYKFRTMIVDAEKQLADIKALNESQGPVFHSRSDPRVTRVGKIIRKLSFDELPQLWNVFIGDMSLVGPRPPVQNEVREYERWQRRRLSFRPGIVCLWQVSKRYQPNFDEWVRMDLEYIDNWSLALDFRILLGVIPALFRGLKHWKQA
ncbi:MAG: sugar transferase [Candidatus Schekmanbacteria bacterium]|nr:sugar transferase [Candidatus Schekmanbacteria bacterium]